MLWSGPQENLPCFCVHMRHELDLCCPLNFISLVNANAVYPQQLRLDWISNRAKGLIQVLVDEGLLPVEYDGTGTAGVATDV